MTTDTTRAHDAPLTQPAPMEALLDKLIQSLELDGEGLPTYDGNAEHDLRQAMRASAAQPQPQEPVPELRAVYGAARKLAGPVGEGG